MFIHYHFVNKHILTGVCVAHLQFFHRHVELLTPRGMTFRYSAQVLGEMAGVLWCEAGPSGRGSAPHHICPQIIMCGVNYVQQAQVAEAVPHIINLEMLLDRPKWPTHRLAQHFT